MIRKKNCITEFVHDDRFHLSSYVSYLFHLNKLYEYKEKRLYGSKQLAFVKYIENQ